MLLQSSVKSLGAVEVSEELDASNAKAEVAGFSETLVIPKSAKSLRKEPRSRHRHRNLISNYILQDLS
jgi:hypothetical protein